MSDQARIPVEVFPVGVFIREEMEARGWDISRLAVEMGDIARPALDINFLTVELLLNIADPDCRLGQETADKLGRAFGVSGKMFTAIDESYRRYAKRNAEKVEL